MSHFAIAARKKFIDLTFEHELGSLVFEFDLIKMDQIVSNLIGNALKFTPKDGSVWVALEYSGGNVVLSVADTGQGIPKENQSMVFERFYQVDSKLSRSHEGMGIGLSLTKDFVELHGGTISVESGKNEGSVFTVKIPVPQLLEGSPSKSDSTQYHDLNEFEPDRINVKKKLLLVEDNRELRVHIAEV